MTAPLKTSHTLLAALAAPALAVTLAAPASAAAPTAVNASVRAGQADNLQPVAQHARSVIADTFHISNIGGFRPGSGKSDHHRGMAIDVMVSGSDQGDPIAAWVQNHAEELNVKYVIWEQGYWQPGMKNYRHMEDRGSATANHYDHVHVSFR